MVAVAALCHREAQLGKEARRPGLSQVCPSIVGLALVLAGGPGWGEDRACLKEAAGRVLLPSLEDTSGW